MVHSCHAGVGYYFYDKGRLGDYNAAIGRVVDGLAEEYYGASEPFYSELSGSDNEEVIN